MPNRDPARAASVPGDSPSRSAPQTRADTAARCHEIQVALGQKEVPEFESVLEIGMAVRLALHIRGLPLIPYEILRLVATHYLAIPALAVRRVVELLGEVEFLVLQTEGSTIKGVLPKVPYYENLYDTLGEFAATERTFSSAEELTLDMVRRLTRSPQKLESLRHAIGADRKLYDRAVRIGREGNYLIHERTRGKDILLSPTYFSENAKAFADLVVTSGAPTVQRALEAIRNLQGVPLSLVEGGQVRIDGRVLPPAEARVLSELARHGAVKPPSITTSHAGEQYFLFSPTPSGAALPATKRDIYERAMALVAAVRQGQFLAKEFKIRSPGAVLYTLQRDGKLARSNTEANAQYQNLVRHRVARLVSEGSGYARLELIDTEENREAVRIALALVDEGVASGVEVDEEARRALQMDQQYIESIVASGKLRAREIVPMTPDEQMELDMVLSGAVVS